MSILSKYTKRHGAFPTPKVGKLPKQNEKGEWATYFFWAHVRGVRSASKYLPLKPRRKLPDEEMADLKRELEHIAHHARHALSFMKNLEDYK